MDRLVYGCHLRHLPPDRRPTGPGTPYGGTGAAARTVLGPTPKAHDGGHRGRCGLRGADRPPGWAGCRSAVVGELHREVVVLAAHERLHGLEVVALLARDPELVALDLRLHALGALVADQLGDLLCVLGGDALLERDRDLRLLARLAGLGGVEDLQALLALDQLVLEHVEHGAGAVVGRGGDLDGVLALPLDGGAGALEVEARGDLASGLAERVVDLLPVDLADDVERAVGHLRTPSGGFGSAVLPCYCSDLLTHRQTAAPTAWQIARAANGSGL